MQSPTLGKKERTVWCGMFVPLPPGRLRQVDCQVSLGYREKLSQKRHTKSMGWTCVLAECLPSMYAVLGLIPVLCKPGGVVHAWNPSSMEVETEGPAFKVILYTVVSLRLA